MLNYSHKKDVYPIQKAGVDQLPNMTNREKQTEYSDSYTYSSFSPNKQLKFNMPFSSIGFNIGVRYMIK